MSAPPAGRVRLSDPAELIAAVPHLLGFHPQDSVVLLALHGKRLGLTLRADLVDVEQAALLAEQMLLPMARQRPTGIALVTIGGELTACGGPPHRALVDVLDGVFGTAGLPLVHAVWAAATAAGAPWRCYQEPMCAGTVADPAATPLAAATVAAGAVTFGNREELARLLVGDEPAALQRRAMLLRAADAEHPMSAELRGRRLCRLEELHHQAAAGEVELSDSTIAEVASALCDHQVRDACLPWCTGPGAVAAERLWLALVRATPAPERAEPAALLALTAYLRGDGALAGLALDAALRACPEHSLSGLLRAALEGGLPPHVLRTVALDAASAVRRPPRRRRRRRPRPRR
ncbi:MAG TPA: DUF4192 domain-containing protein [Pseudonocardiaceae bacterium]|jgi:hypothetical protein|nr:DUF4192 domain-containing protein [Pseudonocardiaceae bacterium]